MNSLSGIDIHAETTRMTIHEVVRQLVSKLGATLVAVMAGATDKKLPYRWQHDDGPEPRPAAQERLQVAFRVWRELSGAEEEYTARNWFLGANPRLGEKSPAMAIRDGDFAAVLAASAAFVEGTDD